MSLQMYISTGYFSELAKEKIVYYRQAQGQNPPTTSSNIVPTVFCNTLRTILLAYSILLHEEKQQMSIILPTMILHIPLHLFS